jgi:hypothetical protein
MHHLQLELLRINLLLDVLSCEGPMQDLLVYDLLEGANLISYPASGLTDVSQAIPDQVEDLFSAILTEGGASMNTENGWIGSITNFEGGYGYWVIVEDDLSFSFNLDEMMGRAVVNDFVETLPEDSQFRVTQSSEQAFYFINYVELLNGEVEHGDWLLSYNGNTLTGIRQWNEESNTMFNFTIQ